MKIKIHIPLLSIILLFSYSVLGQDISLYRQFNGRFDFVFIGNTLNPEENTYQPTAVINTSSSAILTLNPSDVVEKAYVYWAGSGTGDFAVKLNSQDITPDRTFSLQRNVGGEIYDYFGAFKDVTALIQTTGNGNYTLSELDVTPFIDQHFQRKTNFAGWAIIIVYKNPSLPLNQLNLYDGFQTVPDEINITLNSLNVIDNMDAKIGFLAWEGDVGLAVNESLRINGNLIGNPPLNPVDNAFNGTNSFTNSSVLYNMDLDVYNIQNNINVGDTTAEIQLTSGQDVVMINAIVTKLNSQLPDATITIDNVQVSCDSRDVLVNYTVSNLNCTDVLPANTPIGIYVNGVYLQSTATVGIIPIDGNETGQITLSIPAGVASPFNLQFIVDDNGTGTGTGVVTEANEDNNRDLSSVLLSITPSYNTLLDILVCNESSGPTTFDFSNYEQLVKVNPNDFVTFYRTLANAETETNPIPSSNWTNFVVNTSPKEIFVRIENNGGCANITSFFLIIGISPSYNTLPDILVCNEGLESVTFNFSNYEQLVKVNPADLVGFYLTVEDAEIEANPIPSSNWSNFIVNTSTKEIFVRVKNDDGCASITSFFLIIGRSPSYNILPNVLACNEGLGSGTFNFSNYEELVKTNPTDTVRFYESLPNAQNDIDPIFNSTNYIAETTPATIYVRLGNDNCSSITSFLLTTRNCPPTVHDFVSADGDAINNTFFVEGLRDIFLNYKTSIYNRWGTLVWTGNNSAPDWDGFANSGALVDSSEIPAGTYYYVIELNDPDYPKPLVGYLYLTR